MSYVEALQEYCSFAEGTRPFRPAQRRQEPPLRPGMQWTRLVEAVGDGFESDKAWDEFVAAAVDLWKHATNDAALERGLTVLVKRAIVARALYRKGESAIAGLRPSDQETTESKGQSFACRVAPSGKRREPEVELQEVLPTKGAEFARRTTGQAERLSEGDQSRGAKAARRWTR